MLQLVPIGSSARTWVQHLAEPIRQQFGLEAQVGAPLADPAYAFNKDRKQYHSNAILRRLSALRSREHFGVLGVADVDLFLPDHEFVFGEADRESKVAMISLTRLRPEYGGQAQDAELLKSRARVEAVHEVGHLLGLSHCDDGRCVMFFSASVGDTDRKGLALCHDCRAELSRIAAMNNR
ncbi:MAG: archaemetzincin family Zn-dependent metalloprotease [Myxococcales bacterium]